MGVGALVAAAGCTAPADATLEQLVYVAKMRWRIERDYEDLKQEFGLSQYEGRNWTGFTITPPCVLPPTPS